MAEIPPNTVGFNDVVAWYKAAQEMKRTKVNEMTLRLRVFKGFFAAPKEGANNVKLEDGATLCATHAINRKVDPVLLLSMDAEFRAAGINPDELIKREPELRTGPYKQLTQEQRHLFDQCLIIQDGSPALEVKAPKPKA